ncbi:UNVERIFIED_CONTAM: hypothetical protein H355_001710, partial [Colinus virginianus]
YERVLELDANNFEAKNELKKIDQALSSESSEQKEFEVAVRSELTDEERRCIEEEQLKQKAVTEKDLGNGYFKEGKYEAAIECYTRGIAADGTNALLPANRAMAYLKIQNTTSLVNNWKNSGRIETTENLDQDSQLSSVDIPKAKQLKIEEITDASSPQLPATVKGISSLLHPSVNKQEEREITTSFRSASPVPAIPANSFQLESDFRKLKDCPEKMYLYLKQIEPSFYPKLFQKSLDPDLFNQILRILHDFYIEKEEPSLILEILQRLSELKRFDMAVMFMSGSEKKITQVLFSHMKNMGLKDTSVDELEKKYAVFS